MNLNDSFSEYHRDRGLAESAPMSALLAENWWAIAIRGICAILFGIIALLMPGLTVGALVLLFAAYMIVDGVFAIVAGVRAATHHERWGALILQGVLDLIISAIAIVAPIATVLAFVYPNAAWALISGGLMLAAAFHLHRTHGKWLLALGGILSVIWGVLLFIAPIPGVVVLTWWLGAYALIFGAALVILSFRLKRRRDEAKGELAFS
ncbi:MAG: rane protein [bacterium]|nr:rane protein [bacterium]